LFDHFLKSVKNFFVSGLTNRSNKQAQWIEGQAEQNRQLSAQVAQLKGMFEQAMAAQKGTRSLAAAFNGNFRFYPFCVRLPIGPMRPVAQRL
jgi:hypothetical protein